MQMKQPLQNQFLTAFVIFKLKLFCNVLDRLRLQSNGLQALINPTESVPQSSGSNAGHKRAHPGNRGACQ
jgi:hypothetical protein